MACRRVQEPHIEPVYSLETALPMALNNPALGNARFGLDHKWNFDNFCVKTHSAS